MAEAELTAAQRWLILSNRARAILIATRMTAGKPQYSVDDAVSDAYFALTKAAYDWPGYCMRNGQLETDVDLFVRYANKCITGRILESRRTNGRIPNKALRAYISIKEAYMSGASHSELAEVLGSSEMHVSRLIATVSTKNVEYDDRCHDAVHYTEEDSDDSGVLEAVENLGKPYRDVIEMRVLEEMSFQDIGHELSMSPKRVRDLFSAAVAMVKDMMSEERTYA